MNKIVLISLITLSVALACHPSCICAAGSNMCTSCVDPNSKIDNLMTTCYCNTGYFTQYTSNNQFTCQMSLQTNYTVGSCQQDLVSKVNYINIQTTCNSITDQISSDILITSQVNLDFSNISLNDTCKDTIQTRVQYFNIFIQQFQDLPSIYLIALTTVSKLITIPIQQFYNMSSQDQNSTTQFSNNLQINVQILNGNTVIKNHSFRLILLTNDQKVQTFSFDIDSQNTNGCDTTGSECVVHTDVTTNGYLCTDQSCDSQLQNPTYIIGDYLYGKIYFASASYMKNLIFTKLLFQVDAGQVYDQTKITNVIQISGGFIFRVQQMYVTKQGAIQISMTINANSRFRVLTNTTSSTLPSNSKTFSFQVSDNSTSPKSTSTTNTKSSSGSYIICFVGLIIVQLLV